MLEDTKDTSIIGVLFYGEKGIHGEGVRVMGGERNDLTSSETNFVIYQKVL